MSFRLGYIDNGGYIYVGDTIGRTMVHRETRDLHFSTQAVPTLDEAKYGIGEVELGYDAEKANLVLELGRTGGGKAVWVHPDDKAVVEERLDYWKGCYGRWPVQVCDL